MSFWKNLITFRLMQPWTLNASELERQLSAKALTKPTGAALQSHGFVPLYDNGPLALGVDRHVFFRCGTLKKVLPGGAIRKVLKDKMQEFEAERGYKPGAKARREMRDEITIDLLNKALLVEDSAEFWIDPERQLIHVNVTSLKRAEELLSFFRDTLPEGVGSVETVGFEREPRMVMAGWVHSGEGAFTPDDRIDLKGGSSGDATVKFNKMGTGGNADVIKLLAAGFYITALSVTHNDKWAGTLHDDGRITQMIALDLDDSALDLDDDDPELRVEAELRLMIGSLAPVIDARLEAW